MVEAQHTASTMKIVDTDDEQNLLESLLESSKPAQPTATKGLGYWRWRFLKDVVDLDKLQPVAHTAFSAKIKTQVIDLRLAPFRAQASSWSHRTDCTATQALARAARAAQVGAIQYASVRDPQPAWCLALLTPQGFAKRKPNPLMQTWWLAVQQDGVTWRRDNASMTFSAPESS